MCQTSPDECRQPVAAEPSTQPVDGSSSGSAAFGTPARWLRIHQRNADPGKRYWHRWPRHMMFAGGVALVLFLTLVSPAVAAPQVVALAASLTDVLNNIRNWLVGLLASLATVFFTVGGVRYLAADGDPGEVGKAKQAFKSAAVGYGLAALAPILVEILKGIVGAE